MTKENRTIFIAIDGEEFNDEEACKNYEQDLKEHTLNFVFDRSNYLEDDDGCMEDHLFKEGFIETIYDNAQSIFDHLKEYLKNS